VPDRPLTGPAAGRAIGRVLVHAMYRIDVVGAEHVPPDEPVLLVSNHLGFLDGPVVFGVAPRAAHFMVKRELFTGPLGMLLRGVGQIPVDRSTGDRAALGAAVGVLGRGGAVGLFPEGTRGRGDVTAVQQGAAWLALRSGAPVVPVACLGTRSSGRGAGSLPRLRSRMAVVFGEPFSVEPPAGLPGRERLRGATEQLRCRLADHVAEASLRTGMALPDEAPRKVRDNG
jgi:1-acyl-sn-glycerol-3-phosphate acyltransferase